MSQDEANQILLQGQAAAWNDWREKNPGSRVSI